MAVLFAGRVSEPQARPVIAPDGAAFHDSCGSDQAACFALAGDTCPHGYRLRPIFDSHNFLVRCQEPEPVVTAAPQPLPAVVDSRVRERLADAVVNTEPFIPSLGPLPPAPGQRWYPGAPFHPPFSWFRAPREIDSSSPYGAGAERDRGL